MTRSLPPWDCQTGFHIQSPVECWALRYVQMTNTSKKSINFDWSASVPPISGVHLKSRADLLNGLCALYCSTQQRQDQPALRFILQLQLLKPLILQDCLRLSRRSWKRLYKRLIELIGKVIQLRSSRCLRRNSFVRGIGRVKIDRMREVRFPRSSSSFSFCVHRICI